MLDDSKKNEFVGLFPTKRKSLVCNRILEQIRAGENNPATIAKNVFDKFNRFPDDNGDIIFILKMNFQLLFEAIEYYIEYEELSYADKQELKRSKGKEYVEQAMSEKHITEKQVWKLNKLGYSGTLDITCLEASRKISELMQ